jgi:hypothetical protein
MCIKRLQNRNRRLRPGKVCRGTGKKVNIYDENFILTIRYLKIHLKIILKRTVINYFSLSLFPLVPTLGDRTSVKRFVSLKFLNPKTVGRTPWTGDQPVARPLPTQTQNKHIHIPGDRSLNIYRHEDLVSRMSCN